MIKPIPGAIHLDPVNWQRDPAVAVIAFGANLGDREQTIHDAAAEIARLPLVSEVQLSEPIRSVAVTPTGEDPSRPEYVNAVALVTTRLAPSVLLTYLQRIEQEHGRQRGERWGDRTLDLDIVAYGGLQSDDPTLTIPHPRAAERTFVLRPWLQLDADAVLPGHGRVDQLLRRLEQP